jgi:hypothetical protein
MPVLASQQRKLLEDACTRGRRASEQAVRAALTSLAITADRPPAHLNEDDRRLRRGLRAKARQLGDEREDLDLLVAECAYEQWHRLLFARFLAENNLLIHPEYHTPVTLEDCDELSGSLGEPDGWSVAARFAAEILPGIFRLDDPCVRLRLAPEGRLALESIVADLPAEVFAADDALGWVYQFWQKDRKDEVNASERKIGGSDLGPVTQLFTENYMVRFLLENSLGAWWAARHSGGALIKSFDYVRFGSDGEPAAGTFDGWPDRVADVTVMDPCCGSGHFLVEAFSMLWQMRVEEDDLSPVDAQDAVLRDNLFGLELDPRCVQIAMFAIALQAWKAGGEWRQLPVPNIACSGIPVKASVDEWTALADGDQRLEKALVRLHILFRCADTLGSLIDPKRATEITDSTGLQRSLEDVDWDSVAPILRVAVSSEDEDPASAVLGADAVGMARAADLLGRQYTLTSTNVPYLLRRRQSEILVDELDRRYALGSGDIATAFLLRSLEGDEAGSCALVLPIAWTATQGYERLRQHVLRRFSVNLLARLGVGAFRQISGEVVNVGLLIASREQPNDESRAAILDAAGAKGAEAKATSLRNEVIVATLQSAHLASPSSRIVPITAQRGELLSAYCHPYQGTTTGDNSRWTRQFWELSRVDGWMRFQGTVVSTRVYGGRTTLLWWGDQGRIYEQNPGARLQGQDAWGRTGVAVAQMGNLPATLFTGGVFDMNSAVLVPFRDEDLSPLWTFCSSPEYHLAVRQLDSGIKVTNATLGQVLFDAEKWRGIAAERFPNGLPEPASDDPTQWLFEGRPELSTSPLQVAVARLVGYRWPEQPEADELDGFGDVDGIVCLPSVTGEAPAADRLPQLLAAAYGELWSPARMQELLDREGSKKRNIADWLRDEFFKQHCALFENRPFVWHVWDGLRDGFSALVNYHRLDLRTLEKLTYTYLGQDWVERQRAGVRDEAAGAEARLAAALKLQRNLELIIEGEKPFDIFVRWKGLDEQPLGWDPDVNDGVRVNVRPFVEAGVLRSSFNIHWRKDRGRNPDGSERFNDLHLTTAEKRAARGDSA